MISKLKILARWVLWLIAALAVLLAAFLTLFSVLAGQRESVTRTDAAPGRGVFIRASDVEIYVQEWGPKTGRPVLFVHAAGGWSGVWEKTGEALGAAGFRVIAVDMPPLGYSERPGNADYSRDAQAKRLVAVLDGLRLPRATIVGHSFGARAVAQAALKYPERISGVVFVDAALSLGDAEPSDVLTTVLATKFVRRAITASTLTNPLFTKRLLNMFVADPASATPYWVETYRAAMNVRGTTNAVADWLPELLTTRDVSESSNPLLYKNLKAPTLIIWGEADTVTPLEQGEYLQSLISRAKLVTMPGVGHMPPIEDTERFNDILLEFLRSL